MNTPFRWILARRISAPILGLFLLLSSGATPAATPSAAVSQKLVSLGADASGKVRRSDIGSVTGVPQAVTLQTRVPTAESSGGGFQVNVGTNVYPAPALAGGGTSGFQLVVLDRKTLTLISNTSYGSDSTDVAALASAIQGLSTTDMIVLQTLGAPGAAPAGTPLAQLVMGLGGSTNGFLSGGQFASSYSIIGNPGRNVGSAMERSSLTIPQSSGVIHAVLRTDLQGNYYPVSPSFVTLQTSTGPQQSTVLIDSTAIEAPPIAAGSPGGFHLVVLRRDALDQIGTNPSVVLLNRSYDTGNSTTQTALDALSQLRVDLLSFGNVFLNGQALVVLSSFGSAPLWWDEADLGSFNFQFIQSAIALYFGGVGDASQTRAGQYYTLVGIPWPQGVPYSPTIETRSWATPPGLPATVNVTTVLHPNPQGLFTPLAWDTVGGVDYRLFSIANQPPVPWPVAPNAGSGPCAAGDAECAAYQWISLQITGNQESNLRAEYVGTEVDFSGLTNLLGQLAYDPALSNQFSGPTFEAVKTQLYLELSAVPYVQDLYGKYTGLINSLAIDQTAVLLGTVGNVISDVQAPSTSTATVDAEGLVRFIIALSAATTVDPEVKAALGVINGLFYLGYTKNTDSSGNSTNVLITAVSQLANGIASSYQQNREGVAATFLEILTDWGKLSTIAQLVNVPPQPGNGFSWELGTTATLLEVLPPAYALEFYKALIPVRFQQVVFTNVPFSNPNAYTYQDDCYESNLGVFCDCHSDVYVPPDYAYFGSVAQGDAYNLLVIATPDLKYPTSSLIVTNLPALGVYLPDFYQGIGSWTGLLQSVAPQGWSDYLNPVGGYCDGTLVPRLTTTGDLHLHIRTTKGRMYQLERSTQLDGPWTTLGDALPGIDTLVELVPPIGDRPSGYYRVRVQ